MSNMLHDFKSQCYAKLMWDFYFAYISEMKENQVTQIIIACSKTYQNVNCLVYLYSNSRCFWKHIPVHVQLFSFGSMSETSRSKRTFV